MQEQDTVQQFAETLLNMPIGQIETALARLDEKTREKSSPKCGSDTT